MRFASRGLFLRAGRRVSFFPLLFGVLFFRLPACAAPQERQALPTPEIWTGLYFNTQKIGYSSLEIHPVTHHGKPAYEAISKGLVKLTLLGAGVEQNLFSRVVMDTEGKPLTQVMEVKSSGSEMYLEADFNYATGRVLCKIGRGAEATTKTLTIPKGANLAGDTTFLTAGKKLSVGQKLSYTYLEPISASWETAQVVVTGRKTVRDLATGEDIETFVVKTTMSQGVSLTWQDEKGDVIRGEMALGPVSLIMLREPKERALNLADNLIEKSGEKTYKPPTDFAIATAIKTDRPIPNPRKLRALTVTIEGIPDRRLLLSDKRQRLTVLSDKGSEAGVSAKYAIQTKNYVARKSARFPITNKVLAPYLRKALYLDTDNPKIQRTARMLRGEETNLYKISVKIRDWVTENMRPDASIGVPRSATDIFGKRRGVCRDYATLYAALARAAGVPTRLCGGIVYADGKFFYHAWAESYVGEWVTFDPTLHSLANPIAYVDATHIKFSQGDVADMFGFTSVVGKLKITVQDYTL